MASTATFNCAAAVEVAPVPRVVVTVGDGATTITDPWKLMRTNADGSQDEVRVPAYNPGSGTDEVFYDYEAKQGTTVSYRVVFLNASTNSSFDGVGQRLSASVAVPDVGVFLIDPNQPTQSVSLQVISFSGWSRTSTMSSVQPIGSTVPFTVTMARLAPSGQVTVLTQSFADHDALVSCLYLPGPKLLSFPRTYWPARDVNWVVIPDASDTPISPTFDQVVWNTQLTVTSTSRPPVIPVLSIQPMGSMTVQAAMSVTVDEAMDRPLS